MALSTEEAGPETSAPPPEKVEYATFTKDFVEGFLELTTPEGTGLFRGEAKDFWDKYVTK